MPESPLPQGHARGAAERLPMPPADALTPAQRAAAEALAAFGEQGVVGLATLVGYFAMVSWVMNVARTRRERARGPGWTPFPREGRRKKNSHLAVAVSSPWKDVVGRLESRVSGDA